jgi:hypothetical protein
MICIARSPLGRWRFEFIPLEEKTAEALTLP